MKISFLDLVGAAGHYRTRIKNADHTIARDWSDWRKNLILDSGLNSLVGPLSGFNSVNWSTMLVAAQMGTGNLAVQKDTTAAGVTISQTGTAVTVDGGANFFASTDVGALIKYDLGSAGQEVYITAFISASAVTVSATGSHTSAFAVVYQVQQTALQTRVSGTTSTFEADVVTTSAVGTPFKRFKRGFQFPAVGSNLTVKELGFGWQASGGVFSRVVLAGTGDALITGQIYEVEYVLTVFIPGGAAQVAVSDVSGGTWNTAGNYIV